MTVTSCQFNATLNGIGNFVVASAPAGKLTPEQSNVIDAKVYVYYAHSLDGAEWESGSGAYTISTDTLARTTIVANSNGDLLPVSFSLPPIVDVFPSPGVSLEPSSSNSIVNCGRLTFVSTTAVKFAPYNGNLLKINGSLASIPAAGIAGSANTSVFVNGIAGQNLAASTMYLVYGFLNAGVATFDFRTDGNGHLSSDTASNIGTEVRVSAGTTKDDTRSLLGMVRTNASSQFSAGLVRSWFNRLTKTNVGAIASTTTTTSASLVELSTNARTDFLIWAGEEVEIRVYGQMAGSVSTSDVSLNLGVDAGTTGLLPATITARNSAVTGSQGTPGSNSTLYSGAEGYHFLNPIVSVSSGTGTFLSCHAQVRMD